MGFGFYSVGTFDGFDGDMMKLKKGEKSWTTGLYYNFYESKQPNMKELNTIWKKINILQWFKLGYSRCFKWDGYRYETKEFNLNGYCQIKS